jgi:hypothetical protein
MPSDIKKTYSEDVLGTRYPLLDLKHVGLAPYFGTIKNAFINVNPFAL